MAAPGVLGVLSIGGFPGHYSLKLGLTGPELASGSPAEILSALAAELRNEDGGTVTVQVVSWSD